MKILRLGAVLSVGVANLTDARLSASHGDSLKKPPPLRGAVAGGKTRHPSNHRTLSILDEDDPAASKSATKKGGSKDSKSKDSKSNGSKSKSKSKSVKKGGDGDRTVIDWCPERSSSLSSSPEGITFYIQSGGQKETNPRGKGRVRTKKEDMRPAKAGNATVASFPFGKQMPAKKVADGAVDDARKLGAGSKIRPGNERTKRIGSGAAIGPPFKRPAKAKEAPSERGAGTKTHTLSPFKKRVAGKEALGGKARGIERKLKLKPTKTKYATEDGEGEAGAAGDGEGEPMGDNEGEPTGDDEGEPTGDNEGEATGDNEDEDTGEGEAAGDDEVNDTGDGKNEATADSGEGGGIETGASNGLDAGDGPVNPEIVGGNEVSPPRKYGFFAHLGGCGGSLIAPNLVLTAAHCGAVEFARLGLHDLSPDRAEEFLNTEQIPIKRSVIHPCNDPLSFDYDVMILELEWSTQMYGDNVVDLDSPEDGVDLDDGTPLTAMGFGGLLYTFSVAGDISPTVMQEVTVDYDPSCGEYPSFEITDSMICAGHAGMDACQGDSGGPLIDPVTRKVVGIVSFGQGCGEPGFPSVYARVSSAYDWIQYIMDEWEDVDPAPPMASGVCADDPPSWYDSDGDGCLWYSAGISRCSVFGDDLANVELTANEVCCACASMEFEDAVNVQAGENDADISVAFDYEGGYDAMAHGLIYPTVTSMTFPVNDNPRIVRFMVSNAAFLRLAIPSESVERPDVLDLDLYLYDPRGEEVAVSEEFGTDETVEVALPMDGIWELEIFGFDIAHETLNRLNRDFDLYGWIIPASPGGNMNVISAPASAMIGQTGTVSVSWPSVPGDEWFIGAVSHAANGFLKGLTIVEGANTLEPKNPLLDYPFVSDFYINVVDGSDSFDVAFTYSGSYSANAHGLEPGAVSGGTISEGGWTKHEFELSGHAFFQAFLPNFLVDTRESNDLDIYLVNPSNQIVAFSEEQGTFEVVEVAFPMDGTWSVYVYGYEVPGSSIGYELLYWKVSATPGGNLKVDSAPSGAVSGTEGTIDISWSDATSGTGPEFYYVGAISHSDENGPYGLTIVDVDNMVEDS